MKHRRVVGSRPGGGRSAARLCASLKADIADGQVPSGSFLPPVRELSRRHGLALNTVNSALKKLAAEGIIATEPRQGYRVLARANDPTRGCPVAVVLRTGRERWNLLDRGLAAMFQEVAARRGRSLLAVGAGDSAPGAIIEQLRVARAWGVILSTPNPELLALIRKSGFVAILAEVWDQSAGLDSVMQDDFRGSLAAAEHLATRGHERIAWFGSTVSGGNLHTAERYAGAIAGLARAGRDLRPELRIETAALAPAELAAEARRLLSRPDRPTAVLAMWQDKTEALARAADDLGLVPGRDFEMVGWVTVEGYDEFYRPLFGKGPVPPAVTWSRKVLAETALARLEQRRANPELPPIHLSIPTELRFDAAKA